MCSLVDRQVQEVFRAVNENDREAVERIEEAENKVDQYDLRIERLCQKIIALHQPVALDLRMILSSLKINANLERIGDLTVNISREFKDININKGVFDSIRLREVSAICTETLKYSLDALITSDAALAQKALSKEEELDNIVRGANDNLIEIMKSEPENVYPGLRFYSILQQIERIGDHAANIGEEVYFILNATSIRHMQFEDGSGLQELDY